MRPIFEEVTSIRVQNPTGSKAQVRARWGVLDREATDWSDVAAALTTLDLSVAPAGLLWLEVRSGEGGDAISSPRSVMYRSTSMLSPPPEVRFTLNQHRFNMSMCLMSGPSDTLWNA